MIKIFLPVVIIIVLVAFPVVSFYGANNYAADSETTIEAEYKNMENILGQYSLKVTEAAQIPGMKSKDLESAMSEAFTGRYGKTGSQATMQWIQENYPGQITDALYVQVQQIIEAGRNKFENAQTKFIDTKRGYTASLKKDLPLQRGFWMRIAGWPKINLDDFSIISSEHATETFETKIDKGIKF